MRVNQNPKERLNNEDTMYKEMGSDHVQVISIRIKPSIHSQQRFGIAEVEELSQTEEEESPTREDDKEVNMNPITVNKIKIGEACLSCEVIHVQTEVGLFLQIIIYDTGSEVSLCDYETGPIISNTIRGNK